MPKNKYETLIPCIRNASRDPSRLFVGTPGDSHADVERQWRIITHHDAQRGFVHPSTPTTFLTRLDAAHWVEQHQPFLWSLVKPQINPVVGLHSHHLSPMTDLSRKKALVIDYGLYLYLAEHLAEEFGTVYYCVPEASPYPESNTSKIATGISGIIRVHDPEPYYDKVDIIISFDVYGGKGFDWLRRKGYRVYSPGLSADVELKKAWFLDLLEDVGLPVPPTELVEGWYPLADHLRHKKDKWVKPNDYRGDFETKHFTTWRQFEGWWQHKADKFGKARCDEIVVLVQDPIKSVCEPGWDTFCMDGEYTSGGVGYEIKDKLLAFKHFDYPPDILGEIGEAMSPIYRERGFRGHCSTEARIDEKGVAYFIDPTNRVPEPPGGLTHCMIKNFPHAIWEVACGLVPILQWEAEYGVEVILFCGDGIDEPELCVELDPKKQDKLRNHLNLKCHYKRNGVWYVNHKQSGGAIGNVVTWGDGLEECWKEAVSLIKGITCDDMEWEEEAWKKAGETIKAGEKWGIKF